MKKMLIHIALIACVCLNAFSPVAGQEAITLHPYETELFDLVNQERQKEGLPALSWNEDLFEAARAHSLDMAVQDYFAHESLDGRTPCERVIAAGYGWQACGENIAAGYLTPEETVVGWMNSSSHRANILSTDYCDMAIGYAYNANSEYGHYWTQDFGRMQGVAACDDPVDPPETDTDSDPSDSSDSSPNVNVACFIAALGFHSTP